MRLRPKLGRGSKMSIAKAALVYYFETLKNDSDNPFIYSGDLGPIHEIVDIAGAKHCSFLTHHQVLSCLLGSPFWKTELYQGQGWLGRRANIYRPSEKGEKYYIEKLKNRIK